MVKLSLALLCLVSVSAHREPLHSTRAILFDHGYYVGDFYHGKWNKAPTKPEGIRVPIRVTGFGLGKIGEKATIKSLIHEDLSEGVVVGDNEPRELYLSGRKPAFPRKVMMLSNGSAAYLAIVKEYLVKKGLTKVEPKIRQLIKVDLDGDGRDEVLINASNCTDADLGSAISGDSRHPGGDYSGLLLRYVDKSGNAQTKELDWCAKTKADEVLTEYNFDGIADLDGGGKLEIVESYRYYEGDGVSLLRFANGELKELVSAGAGA